MTKKTVQIFRAGTHVGMDGKSYTFSEADVQAIADVYDPATFSAPAVVGHPKHDAPAYGWATAMRVEDGVLVADLDQVEPAFADMVTAGRFKKISASFYAPDQKNNPVPGSYYPRHMGFLGAAAPGVQGLAPVEFAEGDDEYLEFATDEELRPLVWLARNVARMFRRQRDQLIEDKGIEEANKLLPEWEVDAPAEIAAQLEVALAPAGGPRFSEPEPAAPKVSDLDARAAELAGREQAIADREQAQAARDLAFAEGRRADRRAEDAVFVDGLVAEGRLPPGWKPQIVAFCDVLGEAEAICFAEGEAPADPRAAFQSLLSQGLGKVIRFDEIAAAGSPAFAEGASVAELAAAVTGEMDRAKAAGQSISAAEASRRVKSARH